MIFAEIYKSLPWVEYYKPFHMYYAVIYMNGVNFCHLYRVVSIYIVRLIIYIIS